MHIAFIHPNYPAQFGHLGYYLAARYDHRCTFVTQMPPAREGLQERIQYHLPRFRNVETHDFSRNYDLAVRHAQAVYEALKARPDIQPDLVVGHSGFGTTLFLRERFPTTPIINYFEFFYHVVGVDMDFRPEFPTTESQRLRARARNAMILQDLYTCDAGYAPTPWQRSLFPAEYQPKIRSIHDGIDTNLWRPGPKPRQIGNIPIPEGAKIVTYATRGMEPMRGFDIFMKLARRLTERRPDVIILIAGQDRTAYSHHATGQQTFRDWVLSQDNYDLARIRFLGLIPPPDLAKLFALTDLHVYLTVPFVLSWSLLNALACGATVLASDTPPVRDVIEHGKNGLLVDFFDVDAMAATAERVLDHPEDYRHLGEAGVACVRDRYSVDVCLPQLVKLFEDVLGARTIMSTGIVQSA